MSKKKDTGQTEKVQFQERELESIEDKVLESSISLSDSIQKDYDYSGDTEPITVYIGPSFVGVPHGTLFINGHIKALEDKIIKYPFMKSLVVPVSKLSKAQNDLKDTSTAIAKLYARAKDVI